MAYVLARKSRWMRLSKPSLGDHGAVMLSMFFLRSMACVSPYLFKNHWNISRKTAFGLEMRMSLYAIFADAGINSRKVSIRAVFMF